MSRDDLTCEEVLEQLFAYLDEELDDTRLAAIDRHLERCRDCFTRAEFEKHLRERVYRTGTAPAPERLRQRLKEVLDRY
ncbi:mycothiol system anti-sigma-R factor [Aquisalimonas asiatica]|uniref:Mycothiol system anti-sigma-R factor n=1 Tax=Aquisalimonas asiatica TaxID=406100 RepID=A0A1H8UE16_9GAMM|nr:mycothiol system anti-sigma-R factor [Aquisalimonas asiatica]SEP01459.1 mycothiol system anti-sigma-R factor [Aquisalimonas asiatica]